MRFIFLIPFMLTMQAAAQLNANQQLWMHFNAKAKIADGWSNEFDAEGRGGPNPSVPTTYLVGRFAASKEITAHFKSGVGFGYFRYATTTFKYQNELRPHAEIAHKFGNNLISLENRFRSDFRILENASEQYNLYIRLRYRIQTELLIPFFKKEGRFFNLHIGDEYMIQNQSKSLNMNQNRLIAGATIPLNEKFMVDFTYFYMLVPKSSILSGFQNIFRFTLILQLKAKK